MCGYDISFVNRRFVIKACTDCTGEIIISIQRWWTLDHTILLNAWNVCDKLVGLTFYCMVFSSHRTIFLQFKSCLQRVISKPLKNSWDLGVMHFSSGDPYLPSPNEGCASLPMFMEFSTEMLNVSILWRWYRCIIDLNLMDDCPDAHHRFHYLSLFPL